MTRFRSLILLLLFLLNGQPASSQDAPKPAPAAPPAEAYTEEMRHLILLRQKLEMRTTISRDLAEVRKSLARNPPPPLEEKDRLEEQDKSLSQQLESVEGELRREMSGVNEVSPGSGDGEVDLQKQLTEVLKPALDFLNDMMKQPREIEELRRSIERRGKEISVLKRAIEGLAKTQAEVDADKSGAANGPLRAELKKQKEEYQRRLTIYENEKEVLERRRTELMAERQGFGQYAGKLWSSFVLGRLLNLLLAVLAFSGVLLLLRWVRRWFARRGLRRKVGASPFIARATEVLFHIVSVVTAMFAGFMVLWISGDWLLLTLAMLLVAGLVLVSRQTLPRMYEQGRIIMNLGGVREGERVIWRGLPWLVKRLHFYSDLYNPCLTGGHVRLPIRDMTSMLSRPYEQKEKWFPTQEGEWVELNDGTVGKVVLQTPEVVQIVPMGGSFKTYSTTDFLTRTPRNLSHNFRVQSRFSIDYRHTAAVLGDGASVLAEALRKGYTRLVDAADIINVSVDLLEAASSSLDLLVLADFSGKAAPQFQALHRLSQLLCLETAAAQGWTVAFRQVVVHRAGNADEAAAAAAEQKQ